MPVTAIGGVTAALVLVVLIWAPDRLWELAILTTPFQASSLMDISAANKESGLAPVYLVLAVACLYELWRWLPQGLLPRPVMRVSMPAVCFLAWGVLAAIAIPSVFKGWLVVAPYSIYTLSRLEPSFSNLTHCLYLSVLVASMLFAALQVCRKGPERVRSFARVYETALWISAGMIVWHELSLYFGLPYPEEFLYNHPSVVHYEGNTIRPELALASGILRASGPFSEAAIAAAYLGGGFGFMVAELVYERRTSIWTLLKPALLGMVILSIVSTSSVVILCATLLYYLVFGLGGARLRQAGVRLVLLFLILAAAPLAILAVSPQARDEADLALNYLVLNKFDSTTDQAPNSRTLIEKNALEVFESSGGLGAGLGSNVAFTAQGYIASSTGILGLGLCAWFASRVRRAYRAGLRRAQAAEGGVTAMRKLGGAMVGMIVGGITGSHPLVFVPIWYLVLGAAIAGNYPIQIRARWLRPGQRSTHPLQTAPGLLEGV